LTFEDLIPRSLLDQMYLHETRRKEMNEIKASARKQDEDKQKQISSLEILYLTEQYNNESISLREWRQKAVLWAESILERKRKRLEKPFP
jgi:hypothetical protein